MKLPDSVIQENLSEQQYTGILAYDPLSEAIGDILLGIHIEKELDLVGLKWTGPLLDKYEGGFSSFTLLRFKESGHADIYDYLSLYSQFLECEWVVPCKYRILYGDYIDDWKEHTELADAVFGGDGKYFLVKFKPEDVASYKATIARLVEFRGQSNTDTAETA